MKPSKGVFIVIEGADGSGKSTQFKLTAERLKAVGHEVEIFKFPQYNSASSVFIKSYLNGEYGPASEVSPYTASLFYALDRYHVSPLIKKAMEAGKIVLADRFVGSNMAHQGSKFTVFAQQRGFFIWEDSLEFELLGIPRPDINLFLKVPVEVSLNLMNSREDREYSKKKLDEHEADAEHLRKTVATYELLCKLFPRDFKEINCAPNGSLLSIVQINDMIWETLKPLLPEPKRKAQGAVVKLAEKNAADTKPRTDRAKTDSSSKAENSDSLREQIRADQQTEPKLINQTLDLLKSLRSDFDWLAPYLELKQPPKQRISSTEEPETIKNILKASSSSWGIDLSEPGVRLINSLPRNEFSILGDELEELDYIQKRRKFDRKIAGSLKELSYTFEVKGTFYDLKYLIGQNIASELKIKLPLKDMGHAPLPGGVDSAAVDRAYNELFEQAEAKYQKNLGQKPAVRVLDLLFGNYVCWVFSTNAQALKETLNKGAPSELWLHLVAAIGESHPLTAEHLVASDRAKTSQKARSRG